MRRLVLAIKARFPKVTVVVRADSGFASPRLLSALDALNEELGGVDYVMGMEKNSRLLALVADEMAEAAQRAPREGGSARVFTSVI